MIHVPLTQSLDSQKRAGAHGHTQARIMRTRTHAPTGTREAGLHDLLEAVEKIAAGRGTVRQALEAVRAFATEHEQNEQPQPHGREMGLEALPEGVEPSSPIYPPQWAFWIRARTPAGRAWREHWLRTKGKTPPIDSRGGWRFPAPLP